MQFRTTAAYVSGALCGAIWWPAGQKCGMPFRANLRAEFDRLTPGPVSFRDALLHLLMEKGGDFQNAQFTADTVVRIERRANDGVGKHRVHVKEVEISKIADCADLVDGEAYACDFMGEE